MSSRREARSLLRTLRRAGNNLPFIRLKLRHEELDVEMMLAVLDECSPDETTEGYHDNPYEFVWSLLGELRRPELIELAPAAMARSRDRGRIVGPVAALGSDEALVLCMDWIASETPEIRGHVLSGAASAGLGGRATTGFRRTLFDAAASLLDDLKSTRDRDDPIRTMLALDRSRAIERLRHPSVLRLDHPRLPNLLRVLSKEGVRLEPAFLHSALLEADRRLSVLTLDYADQIAPRWIRDACLKGLSESAPDEVRQRLEDSLGSEEEDLRNLAVDLLLQIENLKPIYRNYSRAEYDTWPREEQLVCTIAGMLNQIFSNGVDAIWVNHDPLYYRVLVSSLRELGANQFADNLVEIARILGVDDPKLTEWPSDKGLPFDDANSEKIDLIAARRSDYGQIPVLLLNYMRRHRAIFTQP